MGPVSGTGELRNADGSWQGTWGGTLFHDGYCSTGWYEGFGAFEGLTLYLQGVVKEGTATFNGLIYRESYQLTALP